MKSISKDRLISLMMVAVTFIAITVSGIIFKQPIYRIIPLYVTLGVAALQSKANRYASLIGGANAIFYAVVYFLLSLYATAGYWLLVAFPIQMITFIRWGKRAYKHSTQFRKMTKKQLLITAAIYVIAFVVVYLFLSKSDSVSKLLDIASSLTGILCLTFTMLAFTEYTYVWAANALITILLNGTMLSTAPGQITYMFSSCYLLLCALRSIPYVNKLYAEQQAPRVSTGQ